MNGGLKAILAYSRDGAPLEPGVLSDENKLDGEGPFRLVVPQKEAGAPDQSSRSNNQNVHWPHTDSWDHNAGACSRSATIVKIEPLPADTTDINVLEAGWNYVDQNMVIVYGNIDDTDANENGILDSEEKLLGGGDLNGDGIPDYKDKTSAVFRNPKGGEAVRMCASKGKMKAVKAMQENDHRIKAKNAPNRDFPFGVVDYQVAELATGESITVKLAFPKDLPEDAVLYKVIGGSWKTMTYKRLDARTVEITLTDGDPETDADGTANGTIVDPVGMTVPTGHYSSSSSSGGGCFIQSL